MNKIKSYLTIDLEGSVPNICYEAFTIAIVTIQFVLGITAAFRHHGWLGFFEGICWYLGMSFTFEYHSAIREEQEPDMVNGILGAVFAVAAVLLGLAA